MKTLKDRVAPSNYYNWRDLGIYEKIPDAKIAELAGKTANVLKNLAQAKGITIREIATQFNLYASGMSRDKKVNFFLWHGKLEPIAPLIHVFVARRKTLDGNAIVDCIDFGVLKTYYEKYKKTGQVPEIKNRGRLPKYAECSTRENRHAVKFEQGGRVDVPKNETFLRFCAGIKAANKVSERRVTIPEMTLIAISDFMKARPTLFPEQSVDTDIKTIKRDNSSINCEVGEDVVSDLTQFIQRWNTFEDRPITISEFVRIAVRTHLDNMPLKYRDPKLYKQLEKEKAKLKERRGKNGKEETWKKSDAGNNCS